MAIRDMLQYDLTPAGRMLNLLGTSPNMPAFYEGMDRQMTEAGLNMRNEQQLLQALRIADEQAAAKRLMHLENLGVKLQRLDHDKDKFTKEQEQKDEDQALTGQQIGAQIEQAAIDDARDDERLEILKSKTPGHMLELFYQDAKNDPENKDKTEDELRSIALDEYKDMVRNAPEAESVARVKLAEARVEELKTTSMELREATKVIGADVRNQMGIARGLVGRSKTGHWGSVDGKWADIVKIGAQFGWGETASLIETHNQIIEDYATQAGKALPSLGQVTELEMKRFMDMLGSVDSTLVTQFTRVALSMAEEQFITEYRQFRSRNALDENGDLRTDDDLAIMFNRHFYETHGWSPRTLGLTYEEKLKSSDKYHSELGKMITDISNTLMNESYEGYPGTVSVSLATDTEQVDSGDVNWKE